MNERIRSLAEHAKTYANQCTKDIDGDVSWHWMDYYTEKFAELIVKETMQVVANNLPQNTYLDVADAVIEHFGVEE